MEVFIVKKYNFDNITELGNIRSTVKVLTVRFTDIRSISQVLQCDNVHKGSITDGQVYIFNYLLVAWIKLIFIQFLDMGSNYET